MCIRVQILAEPWLLLHWVFDLPLHKAPESYNMTDPLSTLFLCVSATVRQTVENSEVGTRKYPAPTTTGKRLISASFFPCLRQVMSVTVGGNTIQHAMDQECQPEGENKISWQEKEQGIFPEIKVFQEVKENEEWKAQQCFRDLFR